ncbi:MAG TPA: hypothetical protein VK436_08790 [Methanocella sp.]|nr:hypothetical protein [Methanocella sp.]
MNSIIPIVVGILLIGGAVLAAFSMLPKGPDVTNSTATPIPGPSATVSPSVKKLPTSANVIQNFLAMKDKATTLGDNYGGGAIALVNGEETAMIYLYKPSTMKDSTNLVADGFATVYEAFDTKDPLMVGIVDTSQKINDQQFKVDIYAADRDMVSDYIKGNMTKTELVQKAVLVGPNTKSLRPNNSTKINKATYVAGNRSGSFSEPPSRKEFFVESLNQSGYLRPTNLQEVQLSNSSRAVSVVMPLKRNSTTAETYKELEAALRACAGSYGDYDKYYISLVPPTQGFNDYYIVDASSAPVLDYFDGKINEYQLFDAINLTYYTKTA